MEKRKYGFDLDWFLSSCSYRVGEKIKYYYDKYYLDYNKFINSLDITKEEKLKCLQFEKKCVECQINYPYCVDSFVYIYSDGNDITYDLCYDCIQNILRCVNCGEYICQEPYTRIDLNSYKLCCQKCDKD